VNENHDPSPRKTQFIQQGSILAKQTPYKPVRKLINPYRKKYGKKRLANSIVALRREVRNEPNLVNDLRARAKWT